ncbi:modulator of smoothened protein isoform X4 [Pelodiscus sinensis]|uniref:modulator of smoothened protein isoform X4 n=1 Tax=Pelodiscus sinensis TaxID=13735 RepID=UPI0003C43510|nr:modulator of smoothened protein isoform X6 [Pelodiscus sinensis]|eukprot:XP_006123880.1 modulator of smoothened protein isoform X6 [Pelodiscus sinensis]
MDKLTIISGCLFLAADIFAIASLANPDWINTGESAGALTVGLVQQCQTIHGRDRTCIPPRLPPEWVTTLFFIIMGIISLTVTCGLLVASHWRREATKYARWIAFTGRFGIQKWLRIMGRSLGSWLYSHSADHLLQPQGRGRKKYTSGSCGPILYGSPNISNRILHQ